jgi:hypothetical protein
MSDESVKTIQASFATRQAAELAIEHLTQQYGIDRTDIFVQAAGSSNTSGTEVSGGDAATKLEEAREDGAQNGEIEVSADVSEAKADDARRAMEDAGAVKVAFA